MRPKRIMDTYKHPTTPPENERFVCDVCRREFSTFEEWLEHFKGHVQ